MGSQPRGRRVRGRKGEEEGKPGARKEEGRGCEGEKAEGVAVEVRWSFVSKGRASVGCREDARKKSRGQFTAIQRIRARY